MAQLWTTLRDGIQAAVQLKIITYIGDADVTGEVCKPDVNIQTPAKAMVTCVNLADGDITNCISQEYLSDDKAWVREYHEKQIQQGREIVDHNLKLIADLGEKLAKAIKDLKELD